MVKHQYNDLIIEVLGEPTKWQFGGSDIFVSIDNEVAFKLNTNHFALTDFYKTKYNLDFEGKVIGTSNQQTEKTKGSSTLQKV